MSAEPDPLVTRLRTELGSGAVVIDPDVLGAHRYDMAKFCPAGSPRALVRPDDTAQVQEVVCAAGEYGVRW